MKKVIIAGIGAVMLLGGGFYGIKTVSAAENPAKPGIQAQAGKLQHGKRLAILTQYKDQIHQMNQVREERLDLKKQIAEKRDQLLDLVIAAKNSGNKDEIKQAKAVKHEIKSLNEETKNLLQQSKDQKKALKEALKNGNENGEFSKLLATNQQINAKLKEKVSELDKMIDILK